MHISGAVLDVFTSEPSNSELAKLPSVVATAHIGGATYEAITKIGDITIRNISKLMANETLDYVVLPQ